MQALGSELVELMSDKMGEIFIRQDTCSELLLLLLFPILLVPAYFRSSTTRSSPNDALNLEVVLVSTRMRDKC
jgi:hypothetical protein